MKFEIDKIQKVICEHEVDGWLFTDFQGRDFLTEDFLGMQGKVHSTRRMFYYIPKEGEPIKLLSSIEGMLLDHLPGNVVLYHGRVEMEKHQETLLTGKIVACQYSPNGNTPAISTLEAGLAEYLRSIGVCLVSSANILQYFYAKLTPKQVESHKEAGRRIEKILWDSFKWIRDCINQKLEINEWMLRERLVNRMEAEGLETDGMPPFLGVDEHAANPAYEPTKERWSSIEEGSRLIIDIAGRLKSGEGFGEDTVYYDITWCMQVGKYNPITQAIQGDVESEYQRLFSIAKEARNKAVELIQEALDHNHFISGYEVDVQTRKIFQSHQVEDGIMHRTGHSIGHQCHGMGANLDDYETHDERYLLPETMFSVEPGIYLGNYGVRTEFDVYISKEKEVRVFGSIQDEIFVI